MESRLVGKLSLDRSPDAIRHYDRSLGSSYGLLLRRTAQVEQKCQPVREAIDLRRPTSATHLNERGVAPVGSRTARRDAKC